MSATNASLFRRVSVITLANLSSQVQTQVLRLTLVREPDTQDSQCLSTFETPSPLYTIRAVDPATQTVLYSHALHVCFVNWSTQKYCVVSSEVDGEELVSGSALS